MSSSSARNAAPTAVVFTDLDATLLDHHDYSWAPARAALARLAERNVPVCLVTSKTAAEVLALRREMHNNAPFAAENGGVVGVPTGYFEDAATTAETPIERTTLGAGYDTLRQLAVTLRQAHGYRYLGFGDMSDADVAEATGLGLSQAALARKRDASEPLLWRDDESMEKRFAQHVAEAGYTTRRGGRFVHLLGHAHKGDALAWLRARFEQAAGPILAVALGDSANDADMLAAADIGYWVARPDGSYGEPAAGSIRHAAGKGPVGWAAAIDELIAAGEI